MEAIIFKETGEVIVGNVTHASGVYSSRGMDIPDYLFDQLGGEIVDIDIPDDYVAGGYRWDGVGLVKVEKTSESSPVPQVVTIRQAKLALLQAGLLDDIDAAVAAADRSAQIEWEYATEIRRDWQTLKVLQMALSMSDKQIDDLFIAANAIQ